LGRRQWVGGGFAPGGVSSPQLVAVIDRAAAVTAANADLVRWLGEAGALMEEGTASVARTLAL